MFWDLESFNSSLITVYIMTRVNLCSSHWSELRCYFWIYSLRLTFFFREKNSIGDMTHCTSYFRDTTDHSVFLSDIQPLKTKLKYVCLFQCIFWLMGFLFVHSVGDVCGCKCVRVCVPLYCWTSVESCIYICLHLFWGVCTQSISDCHFSCQVG